MRVDTAGTERLCRDIEREVAERIGASRYRTWFSDAARFRVVEDGLIVEVCNDFVRRWIDNNYLQEIRTVARTVLGDQAAVTVRVVGAQNDGPSLTLQPAASGERPPAPRSRRPRRATLRGRFEDFVVGDANRVAYAAALEVAHQPGRTFRLLVLYGGCGLGKTHLLQSICNRLGEQHPALSWRYVSGEQFTNQFIAAVREKWIDRFRTRYRGVDVLVVDDLHFIANKKATQEEFLHTFNAIEAAGKAVVVSMNRHPRQLGSLTGPLLDRLSAGMVVRIGPPDYLTRREILRRRAEQMHGRLDGEVLDLVAQKVTRNVRQLEGALYKLVAVSTLGRQPLTPELVRSLLAEQQPARSAESVIGRIVRTAARRFGVTPDRIRSSSRDRTVVLARSVVMYLAREKTSCSFPEISRLLGFKHHSTVVMARKRVEQMLRDEVTVSWTAGGSTHSAPIRDVIDDIERELDATVDGP